MPTYLIDATFRVTAKNESEAMKVLSLLLNEAENDEVQFEYLDTPEEVEE